MQVRQDLGMSNPKDTCILVARLHVAVTTEVWVIPLVGENISNSRVDLHPLLLDRSQHASFMYNHYIHPLLSDSEFPPKHLKTEYQHPSSEPFGFGGTSGSAG